MFAETKTLRVDNYALQNQQAEIIDAIIKLTNTKIAKMREFYNCKLSYRSYPILKNEKTIADSYIIEFFNFDNKEVLGKLRILVKNEEENKNADE
jgi:hypothetical protein